MAYTYILLCKGENYYTGSAADIAKRLKTHIEGGKAAAKYTKSHPPKDIAALWETESYNVALKTEAAIKTLNRSSKLALIKEPDRLVELCPALEKYTITPAEDVIPALKELFKSIRE